MPRYSKNKRISNARPRNEFVVREKRARAIYLDEVATINEYCHKMREINDRIRQMNTKLSVGDLLVQTVSQNDNWRGESILSTLVINMLVTGVRSMALVDAKREGVFLHGEHLKLLTSFFNEGHGVFEHVERFKFLNETIMVVDTRVVFSYRIRTYNHVSTTEEFSFAWRDMSSKRVNDRCMSLASIKTKIESSKIVHHKSH